MGMRVAGTGRDREQRTSPVQISSQYLGDEKASIGRLEAHCNSQGCEEQLDQFNHITAAHYQHTHTPVPVSVLSHDWQFHISTFSRAS